jgi:hypothetical protein
MTKAYLEVLCNFTDKTLEGKLADEELRRLLVATDFTKSDGTGTETMGLLDTTGALRKKREKLSERSRESHVLLERSCALQTWQPIAYEGPCLFTKSGRVLLSQIHKTTYHQWTCERFAWYEPLLIRGMMAQSISCVDGGTGTSEVG